MNDNIEKDKLSMSDDIADTLTPNSGAQEIASFAEKASLAIEKVEGERDEYRKLYVNANSEILKLREENRHLKDRVANKETESLRQTTMAREKMNMQLQRDSNTRELNELLNSSFNSLLETRRGR
ncbi:hypothetical protein [endosymbiont GvMRE of Glomus versiforme]|uniref:hypothetical protein n=1 Tax=endosymbiont GvMRE of Glomus versiforme TaxID=2039283 RepID=UPI000EEC2B3E|nr:hypothetical protein [endosymbiont GvMRE of Glomus versiforme]RHZ36065.1 hypothetical protein GvMRE_Ic3g144 [endosymbiont GvMRE of Glomus versiforme]